MPSLIKSAKIWKKKKRNCYAQSWYQARRAQVFESESQENWLGSLHDNGEENLPRSYAY